MSQQTSTMIIGCLLDVSGSMREALEVGRSDTGAVERLRAVLCAALKIARAEHQRDPHALMFVGAFGMASKRPPVVDLCSLLDALLDIGIEDGQSGHELLIQLAEGNNLEHVTKYIRTKLTDDQARIVYRHLRRHPERLQDFIDAIPTATEHDKFRDNVDISAKLLGVATGVGAVVSGVGLPFAIAFTGLGYLGGGKGGDFLEDIKVEGSEGMTLARNIWDNWWQDLGSLRVRPVADVVNLLQRLQDHPATGNEGNSEEPVPGALLDMLCRNIYGNTPMQEALRQALAAFHENRQTREGPNDEQRVLVLVSDGNSTDGDPLQLADELKKEQITIATVYLTNDPTVPRRRLYGQRHESWNAGQHTLFGMATRVAGATHPIPALASMGWRIPSSGECALYSSVCSVEALDEFCSLLLSARFGSADALLDIVGRVRLDAYVDDSHVRTCNNPSDQGSSGTCYAHSTAAVIHMALVRIVGYRGGCPSIENIRTRILAEFPPESDRDPFSRMLDEVMSWYPPLKYRKVSERDARQAVLRRRPVLTTYCLSTGGWEAFTEHFSNLDTRDSVLTKAQMAPYRSEDYDGGHAVVLSSCDPHSLTFLNSWGHQWGKNGSFSVESPDVLQLDGASGPFRVQFYDVYWLEDDLSAEEVQAYQNKSDELLREHATQYPSILELEYRCPGCHDSSPLAGFRGSIFMATCPRCHQPFKPEPGHLAQALYARAGLSDVA